MAYGTGGSEHDVKKAARVADQLTRSQNLSLGVAGENTLLRVGGSRLEHPAASNLVDPPGRNKDRTKRKYE